jgi:outer membrane protein
MKQVVLILTFALFAFTANAQTKVGHINSSELLTQMPKAAELQADFEKLQDVWKKILKDKEVEYQKKAEVFNVKKDDGVTSQAELEILAAELQKLEKDYSESQQTASQDLQKKQQEMFAPLLEEVKTAISEVAKANGFDYVMDSSEGSGLIYTNPKNDLLPLVKAKLGIQ